MSVILIRYGEISVKGANRKLFEKQLHRNILAALDIAPNRLRIRQAQLVLDTEGLDPAPLLEKLGKVFGLAWFAPAERCGINLEEIVSTAIPIGVDAIKPGMSFAVTSQRSTKSLPFTSIDTNQHVGYAIQQATGAPVNLKNQDVTIRINIAREAAYISAKRYQGLRGMPVASSGPVLSLLSGGFDSIAASYLLAKRGAQVDFLHFHVFADKTPLLQSKVAAIAKKLSEYTLSQNLHIASYVPFEMKVWSLERNHNYEVVIFRRLMARVAERIARQRGYKALVFGDCLGQVASQTIENILAVDDAVTIPIFRPLIGMDKIEVIDLVEKIGLFDEATVPYKDCCSIISRDPIIKAYLPKVHALEAQLDLEPVVEEIVAKLDTEEIAALAIPTLES